MAQRPWPGERSGSALLAMSVLTSAAAIAKHPNRVLLHVFLSSISVNALLGIWALLADDFGRTQGKILATSFLISAAMLSVLVNGGPLRRRALWPVPAVAAIAAVGSFALYIVLIWAEIDHEVPLKIGVTGLVVTAGATLAGLLALVPLRHVHEPIRVAGHGLTFLLLATAIFGIWAEVDADWFARLLGVESVLVAAVTLAIPVLSKFLPSQSRAIPTEPAVRFCPSCGELLPGPPAVGAVAVVCDRCGAEFSVSTPLVKSSLS